MTAARVTPRRRRRRSRESGVVWIDRAQANSGVDCALSSLGRSVGCGPTRAARPFIIQSRHAPSPPPLNSSPPRHPVRRLRSALHARSTAWSELKPAPRVMRETAEAPSLPLAWRRVPVRGYLCLDSEAPAATDATGALLQQRPHAVVACCNKRCRHPPPFSRCGRMAARAPRSQRKRGTAGSRAWRATRGHGGHGRNWFCRRSDE